MQQKIRFSTFLALLATLLVVVVTGCNDDLLEDPTFKLWCGDSLCAWKLESGSVRRAPTWNANDFGVELVDPGTAISQVITSSPRCLEFTTVADVDPSAQVTIGIDFDNDGTIDHTDTIAATHFTEAISVVSAPVLYNTARIVITKGGNGHAVLAQLRVVVPDSGCSGALRPLNEPLGSECTLGSPNECASGVCCAGVCSECCTYDIGISPDASVVEDAGTITACPGTGECKTRDVPSSAFIIPIVPEQCDPGKGTHASGAPCIADDDCASGTCVGGSSASIVSGFPVPDGGKTPCAPTFPDAGGPNCSFTRVTGGVCR